MLMLLFCPEANRILIKLIWPRTIRRGLRYFLWLLLIAVLMASHRIEVIKWRWQELAASCFKVAQKCLYHHFNTVRCLEDSKMITHTYFSKNVQLHTTFFVLFYLFIVSDGAIDFSLCHRPWVPPSLIPNWYRGLKWPGREADFSSPCSPYVKCMELYLLSPVLYCVLLTQALGQFYVFRGTIYSWVWNIV